MDEAAAPAWTREVHAYASTRWVWRKEVTTITWWPLYDATPEAGQPHADADPKTQQQSAKPSRTTDWYCPCRQSNWHWRRACYACGIPKDMDPPSSTAQSSTGAAPTDTSEKRVIDEKTTTPASSTAKASDPRKPGEGK